MLIYKILNTVSKKVYIGQTSSDTLQQRKWDHLSLFRNGKHTPHFQNSFDKYGEDSFTFEVIERCDNIDELNKRERYWIEDYDSTNREKGYNVKRGGNNEPFTDELRQKLVNAWNDDRKEKLSNRQRGVGNVSCTLTKDQVLKLKYTPYMASELSKIYGVKESTISQIHSELNWSHVVDNDKDINLIKNIRKARNINERSKPKDYCATSVRHKKSGKIFRTQHEASDWDGRSQHCIWQHCNNNVKSPEYEYV